MDIKLKKLKVYTASKLSKGPMWMNLKWPEIEIVARWPFGHSDERGNAAWPEDCPAHGVVFWTHDYDDVLRADVVLIYADKEDVLRGALVEAGMALALNKYVVVVGDCPSYGTWKYHPHVLRVKTMQDARSVLKLIASGFNATSEHQ